MLLKEETDLECGQNSQINTPNIESTKFYQTLSCNDNCNIYLVKDSTTKNKYKDRQIAYTSIRNLVSHIVAILYSSFRPVPEKSADSKTSIKGATSLFIKTIKLVTRSHIGLTFPTYLLNDDYSNRYYFTGTTKNYQVNNGWVRVKLNHY